MVVLRSIKGVVQGKGGMERWLLVVLGGGWGRGHLGDGGDGEFIDWMWKCGYYMDCYLLNEYGRWIGYRLDLHV